MYSESVTGRFVSTWCWLQLTVVFLEKWPFTTPRQELVTWGPCEQLFDKTCFPSPRSVFRALSTSHHPNKSTQDGHPDECVRRVALAVLSALSRRGYVSTRMNAARVYRLPDNPYASRRWKRGTIRACITWPLKTLIIHQSLEWLLFISCWCSVGWLRFYTALTSAADGQEYSLWACYFYKNCKQVTASKKTLKNNLHKC